MAQPSLPSRIRAYLDAFVVRVLFPAVLVEVLIEVIVEFLVFFRQSERPARFRLAY